MTDIKELAGRIIKECWQSPHAMSSGLRADIVSYTERFLAAYLEEQAKRLQLDATIHKHFISRHTKP